MWALGAASRTRLQRQLDAAAHKLRCYQRQDLRPTGVCAGRRAGAQQGCSGQLCGVLDCTEKMGGLPNRQ